MHSIAINYSYTFSELFALHHVDYWSNRLYTTSSLKNLYGNYSLLIRAQDGGDPQKSSLATVNVCVTDVNDNAPRFVSPPYNVTVRLLQVIILNIRLLGTMLNNGTMLNVNVPTIFV